MSLVFVAVTTHVPADATDNNDPDTEQPVAVPSDTAYVTAPVPEPPAVDKVSDEPKVPDTDVIDRVCCPAFAKFTEVASDDTVR